MSWEDEFDSTTSSYRSILILLFGFFSYKLSSTPPLILSKKGVMLATVHESHIFILVWVMPYFDPYLSPNPKAVTKLTFYWIK